MTRNIHFVGSIPLEDNEAVFRALAHHIGERSRRYPDGETGKRSYWIRWQQQVLNENPQFEPRTASGEFANFKDKVERPVYYIREGVSHDDLRIENLDYAKEGIASYQCFSQLKTEGIIPASVKFQVSLPTPVAFVAGFIGQEHREIVEGAYETAMKQEIDRLVAEIPNDQLAIQWDVCYEVVGADGGFDLHYENAVDASLERLYRLISYVPESVEVGIHLCYGDPGHKHIIEPNDFGTSVAFANGISDNAPRSVNWIHMPAPRDRTDDDYYAPLASLDIDPAIELYIGCVHNTDGVEGTLTRANQAEKQVQGFGVATECGFGRRDPATIPGLFDIHAQVADQL
ncbi:MAG: hypothetical protein AAF485_10000 [Chloroflexota bacterium]